MPVFTYRGYDSSGNTAKGTIEAESLKDAVARLKERGIFPGEISERISGKGRFLRPSSSTLATITRRLSTLHSSGVTLMNAISAIATEHSGAWKDILIDIKDRLSAGSSLGRALDSHPEIFPDFYRGMIHAGESSGRLDDVLRKLADYLETEISIKNKIRTALIYPIFMTCVSTLIVIFLLTFVVPKITVIFEERSVSLPLTTSILIGVSSFLKQYWWSIIFVIVFLWFLIRRLRITHRTLIDSILYREPSGILRTLYMFRFTLTLGFLLTGGMTILESLRLSARATGNHFLEGKIHKAEELVSQGAKLSTGLDILPPTLLQIISTGEQTGRLGELMIRASQSYEEDFERRLQRVISILEPVLILIMGLIVGFIVVSVLLPIFELNQVMAP